MNFVLNKLMTSNEVVNPLCSGSLAYGRLICGPTVRPLMVLLAGHNCASWFTNTWNVRNVTGFVLK